MHAIVIHVFTGDFYSWQTETLYGRQLNKPSAVESLSMPASVIALVILGLAGFLSVAVVVPTPYEPGTLAQDVSPRYQPDASHPRRPSSPRVRLYSV